jgi:hypothetical protein
VTDAGYVAAGWGATAVVLASYALVIRLRIRRAARELPPEERPPWV